MINEHHEFELDGILYKGRMVGDQDPLIEEWDPLRPQNAQLVQGEANTVFNMRPDVLVFKWNDWAGGEGQFAFDPQQPARYYQGQSIDGFSVPGTLRVGLAPEVLGLQATPTVPLEFISVFGFIKRFNTKVILVANNQVYITFPGASGWIFDTLINGQSGEIVGVTADSRWVWFLDGNSIIRMTDSAAFTDFATGISATDFSTLYNLGNYVYHIRMLNTGTTVVEYSKAGTPPVTGTSLYSGSVPHDSNISVAEKLVTASGNRLYAALSDAGKTYILEITPTSAAGAGSGSIIGMIPVECVSLTWSGGLLYLHAFSSGVPGAVIRRQNLGQLIYFNPEDGTYGFVDTMGPGLTMPVSYGSFGGHSTQEGGTRLTESLIMVREGVDENDTSISTRIMVHDATQGALHGYAKMFDVELGGFCGNMAQYQEYVYFSVPSAQAAFGQGGYTYVMKPGVYEGENLDPYAISAAWDFGLVDAKVLSSLRISTETIPTGWTVYVDYDVDETGLWTNAGSAQAGTEGTTISVTNGVDTVYFRLLRLRVRFVYTGPVLPPSTTPVVLGIEARAQVTEKLNSWTLMVELTDDQGQAGPQSRTGGQKIDAVEALAASDAGAVTFKNGITHRDPGQYDSYNVLVDSARLFLSRPGEGYAIIRLIEVA